MSQARNLIIAIRNGGVGGGGSGTVTNVVQQVSAGATLVLDPSSADTFFVTLTQANCAISFASYTQAPGTSKDITIVLKQGTGSNKFSFGTAVNWVNSLEPAATFQSGKADTIKLKFITGLTKPMGFFNGGWIDV